MKFSIKLLLANSVENTRYAAFIGYNTSTEMQKRRKRAFPVINRCVKKSIQLEESWHSKRKFYFHIGLRGNVKTTAHAYSKNVIWHQFVMFRLVKINNSLIDFYIFSICLLVYLWRHKETAAYKRKPKIISGRPLDSWDKNLSVSR